jgi:hypothetical protein
MVLNHVAKDIISTEEDIEVRDLEINEWCNLNRY